MQEIKYKGIIYIRLSDADDKGSENKESDSIVNQRKLIYEFLKKHPEIEIVGEKVDDGWSGILFDRPAFKDMMEEIEQGNINCILTKDLSRLGREFVETGRYLRRIFPAYGVRFIAVTDNIDTLNDNGDDLTVSLKTILNDAYSRDSIRKTQMRSFVHFLQFPNNNPRASNRGFVHKQKFSCVFLHLLLFMIFVTHDIAEQRRCSCREPMKQREPQSFLNGIKKRQPRK